MTLPGYHSRPSTCNSSRDHGRRRLRSREPAPPQGPSRGGIGEARSADGSRPTRLTDSPGVDRFAEFSPDGSKVAFSSNRDGNFEVYVTDVDGSGARRLTDAEGSDTRPAWSPDGSKIAFVSQRDGEDYELYVMSADGSGSVRLTHDPAFDYLPSWSVDGSEIFFFSDRSGSTQLHRIAPDGSDLRRVAGD